MINMSWWEGDGEMISLLALLESAMKQKISQVSRGSGTKDGTQCTEDNQIVVAD